LPESGAKAGNQRGLAVQHVSEMHVIESNYGKNCIPPKARFYGFWVGGRRGDRAVSAWKAL